MYFYMRPCKGFRIMDYSGVLEKGYGLLATKFKDYGLFVLHFKITDYYQSLSHRLPLHKMVLKCLESCN